MRTCLILLCFWLLAAVPYAQEIPVTFQVDMSSEDISPSGVHIAGNFQSEAGFPADWQPSNTAMQDEDGDGIYTLTLSLPSGEYLYKYINGDSWPEAELPLPYCSLDDGAGNFNRYFVAEGESIVLPAPCFGQCESCDPTVPPIETRWWNDAVFYEIFVRSFYDSDGDGIGDFQGVIEKLDYLNDGDPNTDTDLGITGIWLMPMMESPSYHGYDVTDYYKVEPDYGTMDDFQQLLDEAHQRGIKVIIDFVMNHCSSQHPWFTSAASGSANPYRDWFIWEDTNPGFTGPWGQPVWHQRNSDYYYGLFWGGMPDLNYRNPAVKEEMFDAAAFWLNMGVDGFRLDAIKYLVEEGDNLANLPETFEILRDFQDLNKGLQPESFSVGEVWSHTPLVVPYVDDGEEIDLCFEFTLADILRFTLQEGNTQSLKGHLESLDFSYRPLQYATFLTNHDQDRIFNQLGGDMERLKLAAATYLSLPGVPFLYYGEEVGMAGFGIDENKRKPMQWSGGPQGGFTTGTPWYPLNANYPDYNVADMEAAPQSLWNLYRQMIHLRNDEPALRRGHTRLLATNNDSTLGFARIHEGEAILFLANFSEEVQEGTTFSLPLSNLPEGIYAVSSLLDGSLLGSLTLNAEGGFESWQPLPDMEPHAFALLELSLETTSVNEQDKLKELRVFPNPSDGLFQLETKGGMPGEGQLEIFHISGQRIGQRAWAAPRTTVDLSGLPSGAYLLRLRSGEDAWTGKVMVK